VIAVAALAGCGGDDTEEVEGTVREFVRATAQRDVDKFCEELVTQQFLEQTTGATGDKAEGACKQQLNGLKGLDISLTQIKKTEVDGDKARVTATLQTQGQTQDRLFRLRKEDGDWRLAGGSGG
jgi:hypothetical protein